MESKFIKRASPNKGVILNIRSKKEKHYNSLCYQQVSGYEY
jgi:hypothetical protein